MADVTVWLIRHGPPAVPDGTCYGWTDVPLADPSDVERRVRELARTIGAVDRIHTSDLVRARDTAAPLASWFGLPLQVSPLLREMHFGAWEGRTWKDIATHDEHRYQQYLDAWETIGPPDGETLVDVSARARQFWDLIKPVRGTHVVVAHGGPLRLLLAHLHDLQPVEVMGRELPFLSALRVDAHPSASARCSDQSGPGSIQKVR